MQVDFKMPVDVGDLLSFRSCIMHARNLLDHPEGARGQIFVQVRDARLGHPPGFVRAENHLSSAHFTSDTCASRSMLPSSMHDRKARRYCGAAPWQRHTCMHVHA